MDKKPVRAVVLGGGGAHGSYQVGVWQALKELDWQFDIVTGTSVGALNGAVFAQGDFDLALDMWRSIETGMVFDVKLNESDDLSQKIKTALKKFAKSAVKEGGGDEKGLRRILETHIEENRVRSSDIRFGLVTFNASKFQPLEIMSENIPHGELINYMLASAAIYPAIRPQTIDDSKFVDGGMYNNLPIDLAVKEGAEDIIAVDVKGFGFVRPVDDKNIRVRTLKTHWDLGQMLLFEKDQAGYNIRLGYLETLKLFSAYDGWAYTFLKGSISRFCRLRKDKFSTLCACSGVNLSSPDSVIEKSAVKALKRVLNEHGVSRIGSENIMLASMELAGEIFSLDPTIIYSPERFCEHLEEKTATYKTQYKDVISKSQKKFSVSDIKKYLSLLSKEMRVLILSKIIRENERAKKPISLTPLAVIMPSEFLAALYIATAINTDITLQSPQIAY